MAILESRTKTGLSWVKESLELFKTQPSRWMLLAIAYVGIFMMLPSIPGLGIFALLTVLIWPVFIAFAVMMYRNAEMGKQETVQAVLAKIQPKFTLLMLLGLACLVYATLATFLLNSDIQGLMSFADKGAQMSESEYVKFMDKFMPFILKLLLLLFPLFIATWFSPVLIVINNYTLVKAIKSSIAGVLQYTVAMGAAWLVLSAGVMGLMLIVGLVIGVVGALVPALAQALMPMLVFGCLLLATALMFAFQYVSYRDVFRAAPVELP
ncbi:BPSS1780 family membrane protein [Methylotenera sp. 1P/1]|uniref:BPSS1780 family membrane protein n=1 Tax=Methylotenera sp. 1P/1 TaxID=1131551 RepID=UPI000380627E|nr:BPSS1780 family membrane protein [Methylotenera sp. 1P/1]